jgi:hypothetical protein
MAWKAHHSKQGFSAKKQKQARTIKLSIYALGILIVVILLGNFLNFLLSLNIPVSKELGIENSFAHWDKKTNFNLLTVSVDDSEKTQVNLITLNPKENQTVALSLSDQIYLNVPLEFGSWTLGSVYKLGQEQNPPIGAKLLKLSVASLLGLPIDAVIISKNKSLLDSPEDFISELRKNPISSFTLAQSVETNLSRMQSFSLFQNLSKVRSDKVISLDLSRSSITESKLLPDSSRVLGVDTIKLDYFVREKMADLQIIDEGVSIAIFNGTAHPGLANEVSRTITNIGGNVISVSSTENKFSNSMVIVSKEGEGLTSQRLTQIFAPICFEKKCETEDTKITYSRAKINIILGEDYFKLWNVR